MNGQRERGSATVLVVMAIGVVLLCLAGALAVLSAVQASHRARAAVEEPHAQLPAAMNTGHCQG